MAKSNLWYWKQNGKVLGPFPTGQIQEYIILKRIHPNDLMSQDKDVWKKVSLIPELIPDVIKNHNEENYNERLAAAKRWVDDREDVRELDISPDETLIVKPARKTITHIFINVIGWNAVAIVSTVVIVMIALFFYFTPDKAKVIIDCQAPITQYAVYDRCFMKNSNFSKKQLQGASFNSTDLVNSNFYKSNLTGAKMRYAKLEKSNLSHTLLSQADLTGADLSSSKLHFTDFSFSDLSYANLQHASVKEVNFEGAILKKTIWFNGQVCLPKSVGKCLVQKTNNK